MSEPYKRTREQKVHDFSNAREYEEYVAESIGIPVITRFDATDDLDIWVPGYYVEVKEKNQNYTQRWHLVDGVPERNLFVIDELTVRRACTKYPHVFFLLRDNVHDHHLPEDQRQPRLFIVPIWELIAVERVRRDRNGKGKWIINLDNFTRLADEADIPAFAILALVKQLWLTSECQTRLEVPEV